MTRPGSRVPYARPYQPTTTGFQPRVPRPPTTLGPTSQLPAAPTRAASKRLTYHLLFWLGMLAVIIPWWINTPAGSVDSTGVALTEAGRLTGLVTNVDVSYNPDPGESERYADRATNRLCPELLSAPSWQLGNVSGATYSANAFELSVKDAMAQAGLPT